MQEQLTAGVAEYGQYRILNKRNIYIVFKAKKEVKGCCLINKEYNMSIYLSERM